MAQFFDQVFIYDFMSVVWLATGVIIFCVLIILIKTPETAGQKSLFFWVIVIASVATTLYLAGGTIHENLVSATGGPVHWHADFRIFNCGRELDLKDPIGLSNRIGAPEVHEHNDSRIHVEGTLGKLEEASLAGFFEAIDGALNSERISWPTNSGLVEIKNGDRCQGGSPGILQVFAWKIQDGQAAQSKVRDFSSYVMSPESLIPPGDCVIIEFDFERGKTEYVCEQYEVAEKRGDITITR